MLTYVIFFFHQGKGQLWMSRDQLSRRRQSNNTPSNYDHITWFAVCTQSSARRIKLAMIAFV